MASQILLALTSVLGPGAITSFPGTNNIRVFQINPRPGVPFSGSFDIEESYAASPGNNDFNRLSTVTFTAHAQNFVLEVESDAPWIRVNLKTATVGEIAVFGNSRSGSVQGTTGTSQIQATAIVDGPKRSGVVGPFVHLTSPIVPQITSDDVAYASNINDTVTDVLDVLVAFNNVLITAGASADDIAVLAGVSTAGVPLTNAKMLDLAQYQPTVSEINYSVGVTSGIQAQLDALSSGKADGAGVDITGLITPAAYMNSFFDVDPASVGVTVSGISVSLGGLNSSAADLNVLQGVGSPVLPDVAPVAADFWKLADITASASEINSLTGFTGTSTDLNKIALVTSSAADLSAIDGLAGTGVTATELALLSGLTENVQVALDNIPDLAGLLATVPDLNILTGAAAGTGAYGSPITDSEVSYLAGLTGNIQTQFTGKRDTGVDIGIDEISGAAITTVELNYLQGASSNIQAQLDAISSSGVTVGGGATFTAPFYMADGSAAAPGIGYASQNTSGFYLEGVGVGVSSQGVRVASFDGTKVNLGDATALGQPEMTHSGMGVASPAYSFWGDDNTGMTRTGVDAVGLIGGGEVLVEADKTAAQVTLGGLVASNNAVNVSGIAGFEKVLGSAIVDGMTPGTYPIHTMDTGRTAVVTKVVVVIEPLSDATGPGVDNFRMNLGWSGLFDQLVDNTNNPNIFGNSLGYDFITPQQVMQLGVGANEFNAVAGSNGASYGTVSAGATITANVLIAPTTGTIYNLRVVAFGYEY